MDNKELKFARQQRGGGSGPPLRLRFRRGPTLAALALIVVGTMIYLLFYSSPPSRSSLPIADTSSGLLLAPGKNGKFVASQLRIKDNALKDGAPNGSNKKSSLTFPIIDFEEQVNVLTKVASNSLDLLNANKTRLDSLASTFRAFQSLFNLKLSADQHLANLKSHPQTRIGDVQDFEALIQRIHHGLEDMDAGLFPWLTNAPQGQLRSSVAIHSTIIPASQGIIITTGNWHFNYAMHTILMIRKLGSKLPIEVYYCGRDDLSADKEESLRKISGVKVLDLSNFIDTTGPNELGGWAMKPFAMLISQFQEVIFIDADATFLQPPENMFTWPKYRETGALFFRDRTIGAGLSSTLDFAKLLIDKPSAYALQEGRIYRDLSVHEGESGVLVMHKSKGAFVGLLAIAVLNGKPYRDQMYKVIHGDKESYWIVYETLGLPYVWGPGAGGTYGYHIENGKKGKAVCGGIYHADFNWKPLWFNGGITANKHTDAGRKIPLNFTHWAVDKSFKPAHWEWETETSPFCLTPLDIKSEIGVLSEAELKVGKLAVDLWANVSTGIYTE